MKCLLLTISGCILKRLTALVKVLDLHSLDIMEWINFIEPDISFTTFDLLSYV